MTTAEQKAIALIKKQSTEGIIEQFEMTEYLNTPECHVIRGWYMNELERRDSKAFWEWVDSDEASPRAFFCKEVQA